MEIGERRQGDIIVLSPVGRVNNDTGRRFKPNCSAASDPPPPKC